MDPISRHGIALAIFAAAAVPFLLLPLPRTLPVDFIPETSVPQISDVPANVSIDIAPYITVLYNDTIDGAGGICTLCSMAVEMMNIQLPTTCWVKC